MCLPPELRIRVYFFALVSPQSSFQPTEESTHMPILRYACDLSPPLFQYKLTEVDMVHYWEKDAAKNGSRFAFTTFRDKQFRQAINPEHFAFGLFLVSKTISRESLEVFYGESLFGFDSRFDLHVFLRKVGLTNLKHVRRIRADLGEQHGSSKKDLHSQICPQYERANLASTILGLQIACPKLRYLDILFLWSLTPLADQNEFRATRMRQWTFVRALCNLKVENLRIFTDWVGAKPLSVSYILLWGEPKRRWVDMEEYVKTRR